MYMYSPPFYDNLSSRQKREVRCGISDVRNRNNVFDTAHSGMLRKHSRTMLWLALFVLIISLYIAI